VDRVVNLIEEGIDVAIRIAHLRDLDRRNSVGRMRRVVCANGYLPSTACRKHPTMYASTCETSGPGTRSEWHFRVGSREVAIPINCVVTSNDIDGAVDACLNGLGLGMFLSYMVAPYRKGGRLKYVLEKFETEPVPVQVLYAQGRLMSSRVRAFVDECVDKLRRAKFD
jgi:DNA-binding transcriptional LysR family regulator